MSMTQQSKKMGGFDTPHFDILFDLLRERYTSDVSI